MASKARAAKTSKSEGGEKKGSKRDPPQKTEKTSSSGSSSRDESEVKNNRLLKEKGERPKKGKSTADRESNRDDDKVGRDEKKEGDRDKRILSVIEKMEERILALLASQKHDNKLGRKNQKEKNGDLEAMIKEVKKSLSMRIDKLEKGLEVSKVDVERLRYSLQVQLEDLQPAGKADDGWKKVEEVMMAEMKAVKSKLDKRIKKNEIEEVITNLRKEVSDLKNVIEAKWKEMGTQYSTPVKKGIDRPNKGWIGRKDYHSPVHSPEVDWWKRKRKWPRPRWCGTHGWGVHTTDMCWSKKKIWRVKEVKEESAPEVVAPKSQ